MTDASIPPGFNTPIPAAIMTPKRVDSRIGPLEFTDGLPTAETARRLYDHLDFVRGVEGFLNCVPAASLEAMRRGMAGIGAVVCHQVGIADDLLDSHSLFLTGNTDTVYASAFLDLDRDGPTVVEVPPGCGPGTVNDAWFRFVIDMSRPGPDRGEGGRYLIVPAGYTGPVPDDHFVAETPSDTNWLIVRGLLVDGKPDSARESFREGLRIYPLARAGAPPATEFIPMSGRIFNTIHANDAGFYDELAAVIEREPPGVIDTETRGLLAAIGIRKGTRFAPDARMRAILADAAAVANGTARALVFETRDPGARLFADRAWKTSFIGGDHRWLIDDGRGGRNLDARTMFFYLATVNTPAMALEMPGVGSQYALVDHDANGDRLDGAADYRLTPPPDVPASDFWSVVVYDPQTRSELQTGQPFPSVNSQRDRLVHHDDGSITLTFGPDRPAGGSPNRIQTVPGKGWFAILRLYGPLEPWFDRTWIPGDIEPDR